MFLLKIKWAFYRQFGCKYGQACIWDGIVYHFINFRKVWTLESDSFNHKILAGEMVLGARSSPILLICRFFWTVNILFHYFIQQAGHAMPKRTISDVTPHPKESSTLEVKQCGWHCCVSWAYFTWVRHIIVNFTHCCMFDTCVIVRHCCMFDTCVIVRHCCHTVWHAVLQFATVVWYSSLLCDISFTLRLVCHNIYVLTSVHSLCQYLNAIFLLAICIFVTCQEGQIWRGCDMGLATVALEIFYAHCCHHVLVKKYHDNFHYKTVLKQR